MNSGATFDRVYHALKERLLARRFGPGERLDPAKLALDLHSSVTPVRDALHLLTGEGLVETRPSDGFHVPHMTGPGLEDLYAWNADVLLLSLRRRLGPTHESEPAMPQASSTIAERTSLLFDRIAGRSANREHALAIRKNSDRLHAARTLESDVIADSDETLAAIETATETDDISSIRKAITAYHRRRIRLAFDIVRLLYRRD